jgi:DEAD/DEAH box helicase domain-containing protein
MRNGLYLHQAKCIEQALNRKSVALCTSTASGKSLAFTVPPINDLIKDKDSFSFFIYPTKALANDQINKLKQLANNLGLGDIIRKYDGDVRAKARKEAIKNGRIIVCTLHSTT